MYMVHYEYMGSRRGFADTRTDVGTQSAPSTPEYSNKQTRDPSYIHPIGKRNIVKKKIFNQICPDPIFNLYY